jgi:hypothetical protein
MAAIPEAISIIEALGLLRSFVNWLKKNKLIDDFEAYQRTIENMEETGQLDEFLKFYYRTQTQYFYRNGDHRITSEIKNKTYPIFTKKEWLQPIEKLDSLISNKSSIQTFESNFDESYISRLKQRKDYYSKKLNKNLDFSTSLFNGRTFHLVKIEDNPFKLEFRSSDYFSYLSLCESRTDELVMKSYFLRNKKGSDKILSLENELILRNRTARIFDTSGDLGHHFWKLGIIALTVFKSNGEYYIPISKRSNFLAEFPGRYSLVPAGVFQPLGSVNQNLEFKLSHTVFREYMEEFFGLEKLISRNQNLPTKWFYNREELKPIIESINRGESFLYYTGFGIDALAFKPEMTCLLFINDEGYFRRFEQFEDLMDGNWESEGILHSEKSPFLDINDKRILSILKSEKLVPSAAMAIIEGLKLLRDKGISSILFP